MSVRRGGALAPGKSNLIIRSPPSTPALSEKYPHWHSLPCSDITYISKIRSFLQQKCGRPHLKNPLPLSALDPPINCGRFYGHPMRKILLTRQWDNKESSLMWFAAVRSSVGRLHLKTPISEREEEVFFQVRMSELLLLRKLWRVRTDKEVGEVEAVQAMEEAQFCANFFYGWPLST